jgi:RHS repeat-associated protein
MALKTFEYQNKESLALFGLSNINDYGARYLDKTINRWWSVDAHSDTYHSFTPYNSMFNNPLLFIDPTGMDGDYYDNQANYLGNDGIEDNKVYVLNDNKIANKGNKNVNWGGLLSKTHANQLKQSSQEAEMPGKITEKLDANENPASEKYNQYDKEIAVATHLINREISKGTLSIGQGYNLGKKATKLDVNLVKSIAYKESRLGQGVSRSTKASDIFSMFNVGDYGDKAKMGMTIDDVKNGEGSIMSTNWGLKWLYYKSFKSTDGKTKDFQGWEYAVEKYGPGSKEPNYKATVYKIYNTIQK